MVYLYPDVNQDKEIPSPEILRPLKVDSRMTKSNS